MPARIFISKDRIAAFCEKWQVVRLALFGSVLRPDFNAQSDVDVLVDLAPSHGLSLYDWSDMMDDLAVIFGRPVDLLERKSVEQSKNPIRRRHILENSEVVYAAG